MANRSYLYSSNFAPSPEVNEADRRITGISSWRYDIPIVFKILLSGNPRKCLSSIWEGPEEIAIVGDYDQGLDRLLRFLDRITLPEVIPLKEEARQFLTDEANKNRYFILECGEIFELYDEPLTELNDSLLAEIRNIEPLLESALAELLPSQASARKDPTDSLHSLGLGYWSSILYFDLS
jgi:hypothetical protein